MVSHEPTRFRVLRRRAGGTVAPFLPLLLGLVFLAQVPAVAAGGAGTSGDGDPSPQPTQPIPWPSHEPMPTPTLDPTPVPVTQPPAPQPQPPAPDPIPAPRETPPPPKPCKCDKLNARIGVPNVFSTGYRAQVLYRTFFPDLIWDLKCTKEAVPKCRGRVRAWLVANIIGASMHPNTLDVECKGGPRCEDRSGRRGFWLRVPVARIRGGAPVTLRIRIQIWCKNNQNQKPDSTRTAKLVIRRGYPDLRASDLDGDGKADG